MAANGASIAVTAAGVLFAYAGFKGFSVLQTIQLLVQGKSPAGQSQANAIGSGGNGSGTGLPASGPALTGSGSAAQYQAYAFSLFPQYNWGTDQQAPLVSLWNGESGWDPTAYNPGTHTTNPDSTHAFGIPQALPGSKMASAGSDWRTNGYTQIRWGLGYIRSVYGSPKNAYDTWLGRNPHWY